MKYLTLLPMGVIVVLMVLMFGCTTIRDASDEYGNAPSSRRVYYDNPYYGNTIILERDPYTGQLYQISPNGYGYYPNNAYGYNSNPYYYNPNNNSKSNSNRNNNNNSGSGNNRPVQNNRGAELRNGNSNQTQQNFDDAKNKVLGGKRQ